MVLSIEYFNKINDDVIVHNKLSLIGMKLRDSNETIQRAFNESAFKTIKASRQLSRFPENIRRLFETSDTYATFTVFRTFNKFGVPNELLAAYMITDVDSPTRIEGELVPVSQFDSVFVADAPIAAASSRNEVDDLRQELDDLKARYARDIRDIRDTQNNQLFFIEQNVENKIKDAENWIQRQVMFGRVFKDRLYMEGTIRDDDVALRKRRVVRSLIDSIAIAMLNRTKSAGKAHYETLPQGRTTPMVDIVSPFSALAEKITQTVNPFAVFTQGRTLHTVIGLRWMLFNFAPSALAVYSQTLDETLQMIGDEMMEQPDTSDVAEIFKKTFPREFLYDFFIRNRNTESTNVIKRHLYDIIKMYFEFPESVTNAIDTAESFWRMPKARLFTLETFRSIQKVIMRLRNYHNNVVKLYDARTALDAYIRLGLEENSIRTQFNEPFAFFLSWLTNTEYDIYDSFLFRYYPDATDDIDDKLNTALRQQISSMRGMVSDSMQSSTFSEAAHATEMDTFLMLFIQHPNVANAFFTETRFRALGLDVTNDSIFSELFQDENTEHIFLVGIAKFISTEGDIHQNTYNAMLWYCACIVAYNWLKYKKVALRTENALYPLSRITRDDNTDILTAIAEVKMPEDMMSDYSNVIGELSQGGSFPPYYEDTRALMPYYNTAPSGTWLLKDTNTIYEYFVATGGTLFPISPDINYRDSKQVEDLSVKLFYALDMLQGGRIKDNLWYMLNACMLRDNKGQFHSTYMACLYVYLVLTRQSRSTPHQILFDMWRYLLHYTNTVAAVNMKQDEEPRLINSVVQDPGPMEGIQILRYVGKVNVDTSSFVPQTIIPFMARDGFDLSAAFHELMLGSESNDFVFEYRWAWWNYLSESEQIGILQWLFPQTLQYKYFETQAPWYHAKINMMYMSTFCIKSRLYFIFMLRTIMERRTMPDNQPSSNPIDVTFFDQFPSVSYRKYLGKGAFRIFNAVHDVPIEKEGFAISGRSNESKIIETFRARTYQDELEVNKFNTPHVAKSMHSIYHSHTQSQSRAIIEVCSVSAHTRCVNEMFIEMLRNVNSVLLEAKQPTSEAASSYAPKSSEAVQQVLVSALVNETKFSAIQEIAAFHSALLSTSTLSAADVLDVLAIFIRADKENREIASRLFDEYPDLDPYSLYNIHHDNPFYCITMIRVVEFEARFDMKLLKAAVDIMHSKSAKKRNGYNDFLRNLSKNIMQVVLVEANYPSPVVTPRMRMFEDKNEVIVMLNDIKLLVREYAVSVYKAKTKTERHDVFHEIQQQVADDVHTLYTYLCQDETGRASLYDIILDIEGSDNEDTVRAVVERMPPQCKPLIFMVSRVKLSIMRRALHSVKTMIAYIETMMFFVCKNTQDAFIRATDHSESMRLVVRSLIEIRELDASAAWCVDFGEDGIEPVQNRTVDKSVFILGGVPDKTLQSLYSRSLFDRSFAYSTLMMLHMGFIVTWRRMLVPHGMKNNIAYSLDKWRKHPSILEDVLARARYALSVVYSDTREVRGLADTFDYWRDACMKTATLGIFHDANFIIVWCLDRLLDYLSDFNTLTTIIRRWYNYMKPPRSAEPYENFHIAINRYISLVLGDLVYTLFRQPPEQKTRPAKYFSLFVKDNDFLHEGIHKHLAQAIAFQLTSNEIITP